MRRLVPTIGLLALMLPQAAAAQDATREPGIVRRAIATVGRDLKSLPSKESVALISSATAFALFASPFDKTLTYSASCSTFLKTTFDGWARTVGQEWALGSPPPQSAALSTA